MFAEAVVDFDEIQACANSGPELFDGEQIGGQQDCDALTTASIMAASSYQNWCTIHTRVMIRRKRKMRTTTRKAMVRARIAGPQLPSSLAIFACYLPV